MLAARRIAFILVAVFFSPAIVQSQSPLGTYTRTPTLSPYLDLLRTDSGVLPNYQQFVRPRLQLQQQLQSQAQQLDRQSRAIRSINQRVTQPTVRGTETGTSTRFLNYSTFYPGLQRR
ncbi:hypothetical protein [Roseiconus lacunae]|uniref:hypothetical protein n=1 Tax=Roseiconus lacunae TaxID=2605694 RepID=UPI0011F37DBD|nr:hypothetical protein [Roseiconus lacunae]